MAASESDRVSCRSDSDIDAVVIDRDDISNYNPEHILPESPETIANIRSWLQPTSYEIAGGEYRKHLASHAAGTGTWLTSSAAYQEWLQSDEHGLLWIKGIPGSGKSVMAAMLIKELAKAHPGCPVLFFFFRQIIEANHEPEALLRDWMDQVLDYSPPLQKQLKAYMDAGRSIESLSREDMWKDLRVAFLNLPGKVFCVADALDEMDRGNDTFLEALGALGHWHPEKVKVLITSRPVPSVEGPLRKSPCIHIRLQENLVDVDISTYVKQTLSSSSIKQSNWEAIVNAVPGRANGLFLYAKLAMDAFQEPGADINTVLAHLPADLNILYTDLLQEHARRSGVATGIQHLILQAVTHASRPLRLLELAEMIRINSPGDSIQALKPTKDLIRIACGPLLEILADETVSVIHHSFTEYLKGTTRSEGSLGYPILKMGSTHARLAVACLRYLQSGCLDAVEIKISEATTEIDPFWVDYSSYRHDDARVTQEDAQLRREHPFLDYAVNNWHHHINRSEAAEYDQTGTIKELRRFLGNTRNMNAWLQIAWPGRHKGSRLVTQLHIAARAGLVSYIKELLNTMEIKPDETDAHGKTPLWWAATEGHAIAIRELVAAGANPDQDDAIFGLKPLHEAANRNHPEAVKALLAAGVDPLTEKTREDPGRMCGNSPTSRGHTPLMYACHNGHLEALEAFLPFIKDINIVHRALAWSAEYGRSKLVSRILLHPGVDVNTKIWGDTPLYLACNSLDVVTIRTLLQAGADPKINCEGSEDEFGGVGSCFTFQGQKKSPMNSCLHQVCGLGNRNRTHSMVEPEDLRTIFLLLIQAGADIHQRTRYGDTALHGAVNSPVLIRLLLDAGADVNATNQNGAAPLHKAKSIDSLSLLIEEGRADINLAKSDGQTPLLCLLSSYHEEPILKLLEFGPNCNAISNKGDGPLHISLRQWSSNPRIIKALLKEGADPNLKNRDGLTPLLSMNNDLKDSSEVIDLLLKAGADINAKDRNGATLMFRMTSASPRGSGKDPHQNLRDLMDRGASAYVRDFSGRTMLHEAVKTYDLDRSQVLSRTPQIPRFQFLVELGLDITAVDYSGNGLLHELALRSQNHELYSASKMISIWEKFINMGLDLEQKNHAGRTPLHILCATDRHIDRFKQGDPMPFDFVILHTKNLDNQDNDGITPLHMAVTRLELYAKKLLDAGANPAALTHEGLTPLHIAARCRLSNIVGLLLGVLGKCSQEPPTVDKPSSHKNADSKSSSETSPTSKPISGVNAQTFANNLTPLSYAVQSGRPETVALLLEAGADVTLGGGFQPTAEFEYEDSLWQKPGQLTMGRKNGDTAAVMLNDISRPSIGSHQPRPHELIDGRTTRLGEILDMLVKYGADVSQLDRSIIPQVVHNNRAYTASCLRAIRNKQVQGSVKKSGNGVTAFYELNDAALEETSIQVLKNPESTKVVVGKNQLFRHFMMKRDYYLIEELARQGRNFFPTPDHDENCNLAFLIENGFVSLVEKISAIGAESRLKKGDWHWFGDKARPGLWYANRDLSNSTHKGRNPVPFLLVAVQRELPNMDMVRLLIERLGVDMNEMQYNHTYSDGSYRTLAVESAIHYVSRGNTWWHVHQALPYLIKAGADIHLRNYNGQTPLHMALEAEGNWPGPYHKDAAKILIEAGADVNAVDKYGKNCLACAQYDIDMTKLMMCHGALVTADAIFAAIDTKKVDILQVLLSRKVDPNIRRDELPSLDDIVSKKEARFRSRFMDNDLEPHEEFPLYHAGMLWPWSVNSEKYSPQEFEVASQLIQVLLDHGANPLATFLRQKKNTESKQLSAFTANTSSIKVEQGYEECTILQELFLKGKLANNFFYLPSLDISHRDAKGQTLLHTACLGPCGPDHVIRLHGKNENHNESRTVFQHLLFLGADLEAQDNSGRNCLHCMISVGYGNEFNRFKDSFNYVLTKSPLGLINQADNDGKTALHFAIARATTRKDVQAAELLLSAGADPLAVTKNGDSVLHILSKNLRSAPLSKLFLNLVERGVDVNIRNALGETPLFAFYKRIKRGKHSHPYHSLEIEDEERAERDAVTMLEKLGANFFARDNRGQGLLHVAASGDAAPFEELMNKGLDVMLEDDAQQTAIDVAAACANQEVLAFFEKKD